MERGGFSLIHCRATEVAPTFNNCVFSADVVNKTLKEKGRIFSPHCSLLSPCGFAALREGNMNILLKLGRGFGRAIDRCCDTGHLLGDIVNAALFLIVTYAVIARYIFNNPPIWAEEICCYLFIFAVFMPLGGILKGDHNIALDLVIKKVSPEKRHWIEIINAFVGLFFCLILAWYAVRYTIFQYRFNFQSSTLLAVPLWIPYMIVPVGMFLISLQYLVKIPKHISSLSDKK